MKILYWPTFCRNNNWNVSRRWMNEPLDDVNVDLKPLYLQLFPEISDIDKLSIILLYLLFQILRQIFYWIEIWRVLWPGNVLRRTYVLLHPFIYLIFIILGLSHRATYRCKTEPLSLIHEGSNIFSGIYTHRLSLKWILLNCDHREILL